MANISFQKNDVTAPVAAASPSTVTHVVNGEVVSQVVDSTPADSVDSPTPPLALTRQSPVAFSDEDIGFEDVVLPRLNVVQKVGEMSNVYTQGAIVLNQQVSICEPTIVNDGAIVKRGDLPLSITFLGFKKKQFVEKVVGGGLGALVSSEEEVAKLGGTLDYKEHTEKEKQGIRSKLFQRLATALVLVQKPEQVQDAENLLFPYECEGKYYALALWSLKGTAYTNGAKVVFTARKIGHLKTGYPVQAWNVSTKLEKYGQNYAWIPVLKPGAKSSPEFLEFVRTVLGCGK